MSMYFGPETPFFSVQLLLNSSNTAKDEYPTLPFKADHLMPSTQFSLPIPRISILRNRTRQTGEESARGISLAKPLFDDHVNRFGIQERVSQHCHLHPQENRFHWFNFIIQGSVTYWCNGNILVGTPGTLLFMPEGSKYKRVKIGKSLAFIDFYFYPAPLWEPMRRNGPFVRPYNNLDLLYVLTRKVIHRCMGKSMEGRLDCLENSAMISSLLKRELQNYTTIDSDEHRLEKLISDIRQKPREDWSIERMSTQLNISASSLNRLCHKAYKRSPKALVIMCRMERAAELLNNDSATIANIAQQIGYRNSPAFSSVFLKHMGMRPGEFRRKGKGHWEPGDST